jgi:hypothetical protein
VAPNPGKPARLFGVFEPGTGGCASAGRRKVFPDEHFCGIIDAVLKNIAGFVFHLQRLSSSGEFADSGQSGLLNSYGLLLEHARLGPLQSGLSFPFKSCAGYLPRLDGRVFSAGLPILTSEALRGHPQREFDR